MAMVAEVWDPFQDPAEEDGPIKEPPLMERRVEPPAKDEEQHKPLPRPRWVIPPGVRCDRAPPAPADSKVRKVRCLCLHDHVQSKNILQVGLDPMFFRNIEDMDLHYVQGRILCHGHGGSCAKELFKYKMYNDAWFIQEMLFDMVFPWLQDFDGEEMRIYTGVEEALGMIEEAMQQIKPDLLIGFGQGADLATMVAARSSMGLCPPIRGVMLACPNRPGWAKQMPDLFSQKLYLPALIISGAREPDAWARGAQEVAALFSNPEVVTHPEAHQIFPRARAEEEKWTTYCRDFILHYARDDE